MFSLSLIPLKKKKKRTLLPLHNVSPSCCSSTLIPLFKPLLNTHTQTNVLWMHSSVSTSSYSSTPQKKKFCFLSIALFLSPPAAAAVISFILVGAAQLHRQMFYIMPRSSVIVTPCCCSGSGIKCFLFLFYLILFSPSAVIPYFSSLDNTVVILFLY